MKRKLFALAALAQARRQAVTAMFSGTQLKFGNASMLSTAKGLLGSGCPSVTGVVRAQISLRARCCRKPTGCAA